MAFDPHAVNKYYNREKRIFVCNAHGGQTIHSIIDKIRTPVPKNMTIITNSKCGDFAWPSHIFIQMGMIDDSIELLKRPNFDHKQFMKSTPSKDAIIYKSNYMYHNTYPFIILTFFSFKFSEINPEYINFERMGLFDAINKSLVECSLFMNNDDDSNQNPKSGTFILSIKRETILEKSVFMSVMKQCFKHNIYIFDSRFESNEKFFEQVYDNCYEPHYDIHSVPHFLDDVNEYFKTTLNDVVEFLKTNYPNIDIDLFLFSCRSISGIYQGNKYRNGAFSIKNMIKKKLLLNVLKNTPEHILDKNYFFKALNYAYNSNINNTGINYNIAKFKKNRNITEKRKKNVHR